jgi:hypothetical protein
MSSSGYQDEEHITFGVANATGRDWMPWRDAESTFRLMVLTASIKDAVANTNANPIRANRAKSKLR